LLISPEHSYPRTVLGSLVGTNYANGVPHMDSIEQKVNIIALIYLLDSFVVVGC